MTYIATKTVAIDRLNKEFRRVQVVSLIKFILISYLDIISNTGMNEIVFGA